METLGPTFLIAAIVALIAWGQWRSWFHHVVVTEHVTGLLLHDGVFRRVLPAGRHRLHRKRDVVVQVGMNTRVTQVRGQEVMTRDGIALKASVDIESRVVDAKRVYDTADSGAMYLLNVDESARARLASRAADALRDALAAREFETVTDAREQIAEEVRAAVTPFAAELGIEVQAAYLRDLMLPTPIKKLLAANVQARIERLAALERARAEHATMRSLANTARLVAQHPELTKLRLIQEMSNAERPTFVVGMDASAPVGVGASGAVSDANDG